MPVGIIIINNIMYTYVKNKRLNIVKKNHKIILEQKKHIFEFYVKCPNWKSLVYNFFYYFIVQIFSRLIYILTHFTLIIPQISRNSIILFYVFFYHARIRWNCTSSRLQLNYKVNTIISTSLKIQITFKTSI
jgi:hypothetical protein